MVKQFVYDVSLKRNLPEAIAAEAGGKIFTFGSYRLGVHSAGADIDTLCVVPKYVERSDFFALFPDMLLRTGQVTELSAVPDAYVPVIKMCFDGIPIDLVFSRLGLSSVPDDLDLRHDHLMRNLDERCVRSLNGSRVTDEILRLVPNVPTFRLALRCIKLWAKKRAIYSNVMGFLGGVAWAMLVARVCQLYPNATASVIVSKFFRLMGRWNWPQPVMLKNIEDGPLQMRVWNPRIHPADRAHRMPIITPAYPSMCATHNVTQSTLTVMIDELNRAADLTDSILTGASKWEDLFVKHDFFHRYKYYVQVIASSDSLDSQRIWSALVESRLRHLVLKLEFVENLELAHPFMKGFDKVLNAKSEEMAVMFSRGQFPEESANEGAAEEPNGVQAEAVDKPVVTQPLFSAPTPSSAESEPAAPEAEQSTESLQIVDKKYPRPIYLTIYYVGLKVDTKPADGPRRLDISWPAKDFMTMCKSWENYNDQSMGISSKYIKRGSLPTECFDEGELRKLKRNGKKEKPVQQPAVEEAPTIADASNESTNSISHLSKKRKSATMDHVQ